jgi:hypothetical protein
MLVTQAINIQFFERRLGEGLSGRRKGVVRHPELKGVTVYQAIREELTRTSLAHFQLGHDFIDLVSCWDRFFEIQQNEMVKFGKDFVENGIDQMAARWVDDSEMSDSLRKTAHAVRETLKALKGKIDEIYMNTPAPNYRPTTY